MVMDGNIRSVPKYMIDGQRRARGHVDYIIGFRINEGIINGRVTPTSGPDAGQEIMRLEMAGPESTSKIYDVHGNIVFSESKELHEGKLRGLDTQVRWLRSVAPFLYEKDFVSLDDEEVKFLSPTRNTTVGYNIGKGLGTGYQIITKEKKKYYGPREKSLYLLDKDYGGENLLAFAKRDDSLEIIDHIYKRFGDTNMYFDGSKWVSDHDSVHKLLNGFSSVVPIMVMPREANFGTDVFIRDGDKSKTLVSSREDLLNIDKVVFDRSTLRVNALERFDYEVKVHGTYWRASHYTPEYLRKKLVTSSLHGRALRHPGEHMKISTLTPCVTDVEIIEIGEDGEYGEYGARIVFDTDQTYKEIAVDFEYLRPERPLCALGDLERGREYNGFWSNLADIKEWNDYLNNQGMKQSGWLEDAEFILGDDSVIVSKRRDVKKGILNKKREGEDTEIGRFTSNGDILYFEDSKGETIDLGGYWKYGDNPECLGPERLLYALGALGNAKEENEFWNYLADIRQWNDYLAVHGVKQSEWLEDAELTMSGDSILVKKCVDIEKGVFSKRIETEKRVVGRFTSDGEIFYFKDNEGRTVDIGKYYNDGNNSVISTDGTEKIASVIVQKKILKKLYDKSPIGVGSKDDYALFVSFTDAHKKDGPLIVKYILTALLNIQQPLRLGTDFIEKYKTVYQVPLEPAFDLLAFACYKDEDFMDKDSVFEGHDIKKYLGLGEELDADTLNDLAFGFQKIFPNRVTDEDVRNFLDEPQIVGVEEAEVS